MQNGRELMARKLSEVEKLKSSVKELETMAAQVDSDVQQLLLLVPNKAHASVPPGQSEKENQIVTKHHDAVVLQPAAIHSVQY